MQTSKKLDFEKITAAAIRTAKWATIMTKWHIAFVTNGKRLGSAKVKPIRRWQLVGFPVPVGRESAGIVDLLAIRKNHNKPKSPSKSLDFVSIRGVRPATFNLYQNDLEEIAPFVAKYYNARRKSGERFIREYYFVRDFWR